MGLLIIRTALRFPYVSEFLNFPGRILSTRTLPHTGHRARNTPGGHGAHALGVRVPDDAEAAC
jgi:hypothetical protein